MKRWNYTGVKFPHAIHIVLPFSPSTKHNQVNSKSKWSYLGRSINTVKFCSVVILVLFFDQRSPLMIKSMVDNKTFIYS